VAFIEGDGIAGHETAHDFAEWSSSCSYEKVKMVWDQGPGITLGLGLFENVYKPFEEGLSVLIIPEDFSSFDPPGHHMLQDTGSIKSGLAWHGIAISSLVFLWGSDHANQVALDAGNTKYSFFLHCGDNYRAEALRGHRGLDDVGVPPAGFV